MYTVKQTREQRFLSQPSVDPYTGTPLTVKSKEFKKYVEKYGTPKVKSPHGGNKIGVGLGEWKKLIKDHGYTEEELLNGSYKPKMKVGDRFIEIERVEECIAYWEKDHKKILKEEAKVKEAKMKAREEAIEKKKKEAEEKKNKKTPTKVEEESETKEEKKCVVVIKNQITSVSLNTSHMLELDVDEIEKYCDENSFAKKIADKKPFWVKRFNQDKLPWVITKELTECKEYVEEYKNIKTAVEISTKITNTTTYGNFNEFQAKNVTPKEMDWMSENDKKKIKDDSVVEFRIIYKKKVANEYLVVLFSDEDDKDIILADGKDKYEAFLTQLMYHYPEVVLTDDEEDDEKKVSYKELKNKKVSKKVKDVFPKW